MNDVLRTKSTVWLLISELLKLKFLKINSTLFNVFLKCLYYISLSQVIVVNDFQGIPKFLYKNIIYRG